MAQTILFDYDDARIWLLGLTDRGREINSGSRKFARFISATIYADIIDHFEKEREPEGRWKEWSDIYGEHMQRIGKAGNKILQDSGRLRQSIDPGKFRVAQGLYEWFTAAKTKSGYTYAAGHDEGDGRLPKREFMWLSDEASEKVSNLTLEYLLSGDR